MWSEILQAFLQMSALTKFAIVSGAPLMFGAVYLYNYNSGDSNSDFISC